MVLVVSVYLTLTLMVLVASVYQVGRDWVKLKRLGRVLGGTVRATVQGVRWLPAAANNQRVVHTLASISTLAINTINSRCRGS